MRRFSQRNALVTLNDINITPLLDLAFVLLIIFVITTPLLEQSLHLNLPAGGSDKAVIRKDQVRTIEVDPNGGYVVKGHPYSLEQLEGLLSTEFRRDPQLALYIRADRMEQWDNVYKLLDVCRRLDIRRIAFASSPPRR
jgi:biopolymer transport protein ExbD